MKTVSALLTTFLLAAAGIAGAAPVTVTFEDVGLSFTTSTVSNGYRFDANNGGAAYYDNGSLCSPACASNGTRTLLAAGSAFSLSDVVTMSRNGGGTFMLTGLDAGEMFSRVLQYSATQVNYVGTLAGTTVLSGALNLDGVNDGPGGLSDFQTFAINGILVDTIVFSGAGDTGGNNGFSLDNLSVTDAVVPEPGSFALLGLGLLGVAGIRRRAA